MTPAKRRLSPTTVIACLALFFAVAGGSAIALQGKNSVDSGDIKKNAVKSADIAKNAVKTADIAAKNVKNADLAANAVNAAKIQDGTVGTGDITDGGVGAGDLAAEEAFRKVGGAGNPAFSTGGEGDCIWSNFPVGPGQPRFEPLAFYKNSRGIVRLTGVAIQAAGAGGDATCDTTGAEGIEDNSIFVLPDGYRPANDLAVLNINAISDPELVLIVATTDLVAPGLTLPGGTVFNGGTSAGVVLENQTFRAAGAGTGLPRRSAARINPADLLDGGTLLP